MSFSYLFLKKFIIDREKQIENYYACFCYYCCSLKNIFHSGRKWQLYLQISIITNQKNASSPSIIVFSWVKSHGVVCGSFQFLTKKPMHLSGSRQAEPHFLSHTQEETMSGSEALHSRLSTNTEDYSELQKQSLIRRITSLIRFTNS